jgi:hypothetical protein
MATEAEIKRTLMAINGDFDKLATPIFGSHPDYRLVEHPVKRESATDELSPSRVFACHMRELLDFAGYKLVDDAWEKHGRYTFVHEDDASTSYVRSLNRMLRSEGWILDANKLRTLHHPGTLHEMELEPGGGGMTGHFLHYLDPVAAE